MYMVLKWRAMVKNGFGAAIFLINMMSCCFIKYLNTDGQVNNGCQVDKLFLST